ncbi:MAG TPA: Glu-tRNA(Gln) amidotransferase subunit GatD [Bacillales bacterium]|nr:Glu-tRNA(Gln) amidotransferase subunit GatD [Bacillales bacterium]
MKKGSTANLNNSDSGKDDYISGSKQLLNKYNVKIGDSVKLISNKGDYTGIIMPRYESFNDNHIVIKLNSGYNIGVSIENIDNITSEKLSETPVNVSLNPVSKTDEPHNGKFVLTKGINHNIEKSVVSSSLPKILLLTTGGTIASKIDYRTGGVTSILNASDLYSIFPEISNYASVYPEFLFNEYSENLHTTHWSLLSERISYAVLHEQFDGIIVSHGTDTMHYTSSAMSFALQNLSLPVVLVGSQRSSDRPSSDAFTNLLGAIKFITKTDYAGVFVCMHHTSSDEAIACHIGTRVRKNHTSKRNAIQSLDYFPFALIYDSDVVCNTDLKITNTRNNVSKNLISKTSFDDRVFLLKFYPGFDPSFLECFPNSKYRVIILEGTGLGHVNKNCFPYLEKLIDSGIVIFMTSQCIYGRVQMTVYDTGRDLLDLGVISLSDMSSETAIVKAMWALSNSSNNKELVEIMKTNLSNETSTTSPLIS